jgi:hypothetical protein
MKLLEVHVFLRLADRRHVNRNVFSARPSPAVEFENMVSLMLLDLIRCEDLLLYILFNMPHIMRVLLWRTRGPQFPAY